MAITTFGELKTALANWLGDDGLTSRIEEYVALAEDRIGLDTRVRLRAMETATDLTISSATVSLPTRFLGARRLFLDTDPKTDVTYYTPEQLYLIRGSSQTGKPLFYTIEGDNFIFKPDPDQTYTGKLIYWQKFTPFSSDADTNWLLSNARGLYLYAALLEAAPHLGDDPRVILWGTMYDQIADKLAEADRFDRFRGSPMTMQTDVTKG